MMLSGLLDGHGEMLTFNPYVERGLIHLLKNLSVDASVTINKLHEFLVRILEDLIQEFRGNPLVPEPIRTHYSVDTRIFSECVQEICQNISGLDYDLMVNVFYIAYGVAQQHPLTTKTPLLLLQLHGRYSKQQLDATFGMLKNTETLMMVRNPIKAIDSQFYFHCHEWALPQHMEGYNRLIDWYKTCFNSFFFEKYRDGSFCIFYEDIHAQPEKTMRALSQHLSITFHESLLKETQDSQPMGMVALKKNLHIINTSPERAKDTTLKILRPTDVWFIEFFLKDIIEDLGYALRSNVLQRAVSPFLISPLQLGYFKKLLVYIWNKRNHITIIFLLSVSALIRLIFDRPLLLLFFKIKRKKIPYNFRVIKP